MSATVSGEPEPKGTNPTSVGVWPKGYNKITGLFKLGGGDIFVKMHLLAGRLGGKNQKSNLIPGSQSVNVGAPESHNNRELAVYSYLRSAKNLGRVNIKAKVRYRPITDQTDGHYWWPKELDWSAWKGTKDTSNVKWKGVGMDPITFPSLEKEDDDDYSDSAGSADIEEMYGGEEIDIWD